MKKLIFYLFTICTGLMQMVNAQTITGVVTGFDDDQPLPGVNIQIKGTDQGTITDLTGAYSIEVSGEDAVLIFSYIGFVSQQQTVGSRTTINIALEIDPKGLHEIIVVGYGTLKKSDIVSSVATINVEDVVTIPTTNINEMLRGRAAGVQVSVGSLRPGGTSNIVIRGKNSLAGDNNPIYIVDGVAKDDINDINPDDITSIEILKDASAQAIYGARASNGVILITTKRGEERGLQISYHGYFTTQSISKNFDLYSGNEYADLRREAFRTDNPDDEYEQDDFVFTEEELAILNSQNFANWEDLVIRRANIISNTLSVRGGSEKTKVFSSINYFMQDGIIPSSAFKRGTFRLNLDQTVNDKLSLSFNVAITSNSQDKESSSLNLITLSPLGQVYDEEGELVRYPIGSASYTNPLWNIRESNNDIKANSYDLYFLVKYDIVKNFSYTLNSSLSRKTTDEGLYYSSLHSTGRNTNGFAEISNSLRENFLIENIFRYENQFNDNHKLDVTFVQSIDERKYSATSTTGTEFSNDILVP